jgi:dephospho-CoA kinase
MPAAIRNRSFVIGLTGSIGMGKTETAKLFAAEGVPVFDADAVVHDLYAGEAAGVIETAFPGTTKNGAVDRMALAAWLGGDADALKRLEALVHPLVAARKAEFLAQNGHAPVVVLDIPLLLETGEQVDAVVVATAPPAVQRARVLARPGMTEAKFDALLERQMSDAQKRQQADYLVMTDQGLDHAREQVKMILADIRNKLRA